MKKDSLKRLIISAAALLILTICTIIYRDSVPFTSVLGAYLSIIIISAVLFKFSQRLYTMALIFDIFAAVMGSVAGLYGKIPFYDRIVHFISGVILADLGYFLISYLFKKYNVKPIPVICNLFSALFSFACAGIWEIYEFSADLFIKTSMQGSNLDTMGDIVAGVLGGILYIIIIFISGKVSSISKKKAANP